MTFNSIQDIINVIEKPFASALLVDAIESQDKHKLHITGEGFEALVKEKMTSVESSKNYDIKAKVARPTTTRIYKQILNQYHKVFRAKGFFKKYSFKNNDENLVNDFKEYLEDIGGGLSMDQLMQIAWFKNSFEEFNGVFLVDLPKEQVDEFAEPFVTFKSLEHIHDISIDGENIEYIIFVWKTKQGRKTIKHYRVIDDTFDYQFIEEDGIVKLDSRTILNEAGELEVVDDIIPNIWGYVPAMQPSALNKYANNDTLKKSFVEETMSNADYYLSISNDHATSVKLHQNPIFYSYPVSCTSCNGTGEQDIDNSLEVCGFCSGSGNIPFYKKDASEGITIPEPLEDQAFNAQAPCGYVAPDLDTLKEQRVEMQNEEMLIEKGALGTDGVLTSEKSQDTATGKEIDTQPLFDTLTNFSNNGQMVEEFLTKAIGEARYNDSNDTGKRFEGAIILWGKQFFVRSIQVIENEYIEAKKGGSPDYLLKALLEELNFTKYDNNPQAKQRAVTLSILEPFVTKTVEEIKPLGVDVVDYTIKTYFNDFIERFEIENTDIVNFMSNSPFKSKIQKINDELIKYAEEKIALMEERNRIIPPDVEAEAKATLRGSVGGIDGLIKIQTAVAAGIVSKEAGQKTIEEFYGVTPEVASSMFTTNPKPIVESTPKPI